MVVPAATAVINPVAELIVAMLVLELDHTMVRPVSVLLPASFNTAVACAVCTALIVLGVSVTATVATGAAVTVIVAKFDFVSLVAVISAVPTATAVTTPVFALTVATIRPRSRCWRSTTTPAR